MTQREKNAALIENAGRIKVLRNDVETGLSSIFELISAENKQREIRATTPDDVNK